eukprot:664335-Pleurochrysis_carterae.AAC.1
MLMYILCAPRRRTIPYALSCVNHALCESAVHAGAALSPRVIKHLRPIHTMLVFAFSQRRKPPTPFQTEITFTRP